MVIHVNRLPLYSLHHVSLLYSHLLGYKDSSQSFFPIRLPYIYTVLLTTPLSAHLNTSTLGPLLVQLSDDFQSYIFNINPSGQSRCLDPDA